MAKKDRYREKDTLTEEQMGNIKETTVAVADEVASAPKVDFDAWYASRGRHIPKHHHKEILKADFMGRGLNMFETMEDFDRALAQYGIKLD